jgi:hypothetical protein
MLIDRTIAVGPNVASLSHGELQLRDNKIKVQSSGDERFCFFDSSRRFLDEEIQIFLEAAFIQVGYQLRQRKEHFEILENGQRVGLVIFTNATGDPDSALSQGLRITINGHH